MSPLARIATDHGNRLIGASLALITIADLLGADSAEHHLNSDHIDGLQHAAKVIAEVVKCSGYDLCEQAEQASEGAQ
ncbi:hypothetical protein ACK9U2_000938 [Pseudomonas putida]|uniref:hypothetical protein n=1 Tax=Pseudomonas shirazica TaxID=1940636 RepID=UPI003524954C